MLYFSVEDGSVVEEHWGLQDVFIFVKLVHLGQEQSGEGPIPNINDG